MTQINHFFNVKSKPKYKSYFFLRERRKIKSYLIMDFKAPAKFALNVNSI